MEQAILDVNKQAESSSADVKGEASSASTDAKQETPLSIALAAAKAGVSSDTPDKVKSDDKTTQEDASAPESRSVTEHDKAEDATPESEEEPTSDEDEKTEDEVKEDEEVVEEDAPSEDGKLEKTFAQSKRFQELNQKVKDLEPYANQARTINDYCEKNGISGDQLRDALRITALMNDPTKVDDLRKEMQPFFESLGFATGERLPEDLQKDVNEGVMSVDRARELARYRAQTHMQTQMQKNAQVRQSQQQVAVALGQWEQSKAKSDPEWQKRLPVINALYQAKVHAHQGLPSASDHVRYAEESYLEAKGFTASFMPKPAVKKVLRTNGSSKQVKASPKTPLEVATAVASGQKISF